MGSRWEYPQSRPLAGTALDVGVNIPLTCLGGVIAALVESGELGECERWLVRRLSLGLKPMSTGWGQRGGSREGLQEAWVEASRTGAPTMA